MFLELNLISFMTQIPVKRILKEYLNEEETKNIMKLLEEIKNNKYLYISR